MRAALLAMGLAGCANVEPGTTELARLDRTRFELSVQPILAESCANPSCHGRPERALSLYAPRRFREDSSRTHLDEPLTSEELAHNFRAASALVDPHALEQSPLLRKSLGERSGSYHGGGVVFDGENDDRYRTLLAWVGGAR